MKYCSPTLQHRVRSLRPRLRIAYSLADNHSLLSRTLPRMP